MNENESGILEEYKSFFTESDLAKPIKELSFSSRKLTAVIMALLSDATIILLDNPCEGLDYDLKLKLL